MAEAKKDLNKLLEHLVDINKELERKIRKLYQQVNLKTEECIKNYSQGNIEEIKEVVALVRKTNSALLDHNKIISDVKKKLDEIKKRQTTHEAVDCGRILTMKLNLTDTTCTSAENDHQGNENEKSEINKKENTSLEKRIEHVETELNSVKDTKQKTEDYLSEMKQWKENILENRIKYIEDMISILQKATEKMKEQSVTEKCDMDKQILHVTKKTKKKFKNLQQKMNLQNDTIHELQNKESICLPEINDWRDKSISEQSDILIKMKQLSDEQKENYLNLKQQCTEDENKIGEMSQLIEILMENYAKTCRSLEQVNIDIETVKSNVNEMEKKLKVNTDESDNIARIVASHSELICVLQNVGKEHVASSENQIEQLKTMLATLENDMITRSNELKTIKACVCNRYACYVELDNLTPVSEGSIISTFSKVREYNGQHFNQRTGKFVSPHDGLYLVCVSLHEDKRIVVGVIAGDRWWKTIEVKSADTSTAGSVVVDMKKSQELYFYVYRADHDAKLSWFSSFIIVSL